VDIGRIDLERFLIFYTNSHLQDCMTKVIKILQINLARNAIGRLSDETYSCVHTLTSNLLLGVQSYNTTGVKVTNL
jgi:hypothetical protein